MRALEYFKLVTLKDAFKTHHVKNGGLFSREYMNYPLKLYYELDVVLTTH